MTTRLEMSTGRPLTLVSAPPGYGKTTLVSEWAAQSKWHVAWVALDMDDNDPAQFWAYVVAALRQPQRGAGESTWAFPHAGREDFDHHCLISLLNEIDAFDDDVVLVLDDYEVIESATVHEGMRLFIKHLPRGLHLVIVSRTDPPLPLAQLRARSWLCEFRAADLAFTREETERFLDRPDVPPPSPTQLDLLQERTQGWPAGLELASLALAGSTEPGTLEGPLRGSLPLVSEFLMEEVLRQQPNAIREFLLKTSVLQQVSASLCDHVLEDTSHGSADVLDMLQRCNMFLLPVDDEREWFRYHPLFAEIMRDQLKRIDPTALSRLLNRASHWHEAQGRYVDAVACAESVPDLERVADIVAASRHVLVERGEFGILRELVEKVPATCRTSGVGLALSRAWAFVPAGSFEEAGEALEEARRLADEPSVRLVGDRPALRQPWATS